MNTRIYRRLSGREREEISRGLAAGKTQEEIADMLERDPGTISREINRNSGRSGYRAFSAGRRAAQAASSRQYGKRRISKGKRLRAYVFAGLRRRWSPREIVKRMRKEYPYDMDMRISHEAIYRYIYALPRGTLKQTLIKALRQERKYRRKKDSQKGTTAETRGKIADMLSIEERPKEVADRSVPGHWEGDLIMGKHKDAVSVRKAYARALRFVPEELAKTLTYDQMIDLVPCSIT